MNLDGEGWIHASFHFHTKLQGQHKAEIYWQSYCWWNLLCQKLKTQFEEQSLVLLPVSNDFASYTKVICHQCCICLLDVLYNGDKKRTCWIMVASSLR